MNFRFPILNFRLTWAVVCAGLLSSVSAQEAAATLGKPAKATSVRCWAALGEPGAKETYSLVYVGGTPKTEGAFFTGIAGCYKTGYGAGYLDIPAGDYHLNLVRDGAAPVVVASLQTKLAEETGYGLVAVLVNGKATLGLTQEFPVPKEETGGLFIYNLIPAPPLQLSVGKGAARLVSNSETPLFLSTESLAGQPIVLSYLTKRNTIARLPVELPPAGRVSVVFMRNNYSQPSLLVFPAEPPNQ